MAQIKNLLLLLLGICCSVFLLSQCTTAKDSSFEYKQAPSEGWIYSSSIHFPILVTEGQKTYDVSFFLRYNTFCVYDKLELKAEWWFHEKKVYSDTISFDLLKAREKEKTIGLLSEIELPAKKVPHLPHSGMYTLALSPLKKDSLLYGIETVGLLYSCETQRNEQ